MKIEFFASGDPKGQPRVKASRRGKFVHIYTPKIADEWKLEVATAFALYRDQVPAEYTGIEVHIAAYFRRPQSHYGTGKNALIVKDAAPNNHASKPDCDNVAKAILDALTTAGAWTDDAEVTTLAIIKRWSKTPGAQIRITYEEPSHD